MHKILLCCLLDGRTYEFMYVHSCTESRCQPNLHKMRFSASKRMTAIIHYQPSSAYIFAPVVHHPGTFLYSFAGHCDHCGKCIISLAPVTNNLALASLASSLECLQGSKLSSHSFLPPVQLTPNITCNAEYECDGCSSSFVDHRSMFVQSMSTWLVKSKICLYINHNVRVNATSG